MANDTVIQNLIERFDAPLKEYYKRRIIFWHDIDGEFAEEINEIQIPNVKVLILTGTNNFYAKKLLLEDDTESNYLVYNPIEYEKITDNWLLDIELCNEEFRADFLSMKMEEIGIPDNSSNRKTMKLFSKFFNNKERVARLKNYNGDYSVAGQLRIDVMAALAGSLDNSDQGLIRTVLMSGLDLASNDSYQSMIKFGETESFWKLIEHRTGYMKEEDTSSLLPLMSHLIVTTLSNTMSDNCLKGLEDYISIKHQEYCYSLIHEWMHSEYDDALYEIARQVEKHLHLEDRFSKLEVVDLVNSDCLPCINECILRRFMNEINDNVIKADDIIKVVEKRRTMKWFKRVRYYYDGLLQVANMQQFFQNHQSAFHIAEHDEMWKAYASDYYQMDKYYRLFHLAFNKSLKQSCTVLDDQYKNVADYVENLYKNWFLQKVGTSWSNITVDELEKDSKLAAISQQEDFYNKYVVPMKSNGRVYVIVSDALRYEVAVQLTEELIQKTNGSAKLTNMQSIIPSVTKYGMAALLPHRKLQITDDGRMLCDGMSTEGTENREIVLKASEPSAVAITYKNMLAMKRDERRQKFEGAKVVYIYHNAIDAIGDKAVTEDKVFEACEDAINELTTLVRTITNELSGSNILITADHGFLYSYKPLEEKDKGAKDFVGGNIIELDRRFIVSDVNAKPDFMISVNTTSYLSEKYTYVPYEYVRIKKQGGGMNYVHGGSSLQELMVPVISFRNVRTSSKKFEETVPVTIALLNQSRKISNTMFNLDFYQKEAVGGKLTPATYEVAVRNASGRAVSDVKVIIADKTSPDANDRRFRVRFTLKSTEFDKTESYYLTINEKGKSDFIESIEYHIDIAFADDGDFDF